MNYLNKILHWCSFALYRGRVMSHSPQAPQILLYIEAIVYKYCSAHNLFWFFIGQKNENRFSKLQSASADFSPFPQV